jgi:Tfp pilus assembly protein PilN
VSTTSPFAGVTFGTGAAAAPDSQALVVDVGGVVRVDLLPEEVVRARRLKATQHRLGAGLLALAAVLAGGVWWATSSTAQAAEELAAAEARTATLQAREAEFAEVPRVLSEVQGARDAQTLAMAGDVLWHRFLDDLALTYPSEVWLTNLTVTVAGPGGASAAVTTPATTGATTGVAALGTLDVTGRAFEHSDVAAWMDVLDGTPGYADATLSSSKRTAVGDRPVVDFSTRAGVTSDALSRRFEQEAR